jgi:putative sigma-54 modulation protein
MDIQFNITGKHVEITEALRQHAQDKVSKFSRYYNSINHVEVKIERPEGHLATVEIIARAEHNKVFVARESGSDIFTCVDMATHKIERQLTKKKTRERDNKYAGGAAAVPPPESVEEV